jgi:predicted  nucleic acid-binding Zn-ribbon protein
MSTEAKAITHTLCTLHRMHRQLSDLNSRMSRFPRLIQAHEANLKKLEADLEAVRAESVKLKIATDEKQMQLSSREATVEKRRLQLQQAADNREYQALREQIAADEMGNSVLADEILEAMEKADALQEKVAAAEAAAARGREELARVRKEADEQSPVIQADLSRLKAELAQQEAALPSEFKDNYRRAVRSKGEDALAEIQGEFCGGCNQHIPLNLVSKLMLGEPLTCRSCGALLYFPEAAGAR